MNSINTNMFFNRIGLAVIKNAPKIAMVLGSSAIVGGTILIAKASTKFEDVAVDHQERVETLKANIEKNVAEDERAKVQRKEITKAYCKTGSELAKLYGPGVALETAGLVALNVTVFKLDKKSQVLGSALTGVTAAYSAYRDRVKKLLGEQVDQDIINGAKTVTEPVETVDEHGEKVVEMETKTVLDPIASPYTHIFDSTSRWHKENSMANEFTLKSAQAHFNDTLRLRGHVYLNEVLIYLDIPSTKAGQYVGWVYDKSQGLADSFIDFGIYSPANERALARLENVYVLNFNCQGDIQNIAHI